MENPTLSGGSGAGVGRVALGERDSNSVRQCHRALHANARPSPAPSS